MTSAAEAMTAPPSFAIDCTDRMPEAIFAPPYETGVSVRPIASSIEAFSEPASVLSDAISVRRLAASSAVSLRTVRCIESTSEPSMICGFGP